MVKILVPIHLVQPGKVHTCRLVHVHLVLEVQHKFPAPILNANPPFISESNNGSKTFFLTNVKGTFDSMKLECRKLNFSFARLERAEEVTAGYNTMKSERTDEAWIALKKKKSFINRESNSCFGTFNMETVLPMLQWTDGGHSKVRHLPEKWMSNFLLRNRVSNIHSCKDMCLKLYTSSRFLNLVDESCSAKYRVLCSGKLFPFVFCENG